MSASIGSPPRPGTGKALFITYLLPRSEEGAAAGIYRRQRMLIEAIKTVCGEIDVLFYALAHEARPAAGSAHDFAATLDRLWGGTFRVFVCDREAITGRQNFWRRYVRPATGFMRLPGYESFAGDRQRIALEECLARRPDFIFVHRLMCMPPLLRAMTPLPPVFLDLDDIEHVAFARSISQPPIWPGKRLFHLQLPALRSGERRALGLARAAFVCSTLDREDLRRSFRVDNVETIENAMEIPLPSPVPARASLLIIGGYGYAPNRAAAEFFLENVWPLVLLAAPHACLTIAGPKPEAISHYANPPAGVVFSGFVADLDALYANIRVVVCPILSGAGTRVKIVEAAAYGRPIVSTVLGAEGLDLRDGEEILLRDSPDQFAAACIELLLNDQLAAELGARARQAALGRFDRAKVVARLAKTLKQSLPGTEENKPTTHDREGGKTC